MSGFRVCPGTDFRVARGLQRVGAMLMMSLRNPRSLAVPVLLAMTALAGTAAVARAARTDPTPPPPEEPAPAGTVTFEGDDGDASFEIKSFAVGVENTTSIGSATGGAGAGKVKFSEFTIKKTTDKASPSLLKNCAVGAHYKTVVIAMRKSGGDPLMAADAFVEFTFEDATTTKIDWSGPGAEGPEESITFVYGKMGMKAADSDGAVNDSGFFDSGWYDALM